MKTINNLYDRLTSFKTLYKSYYKVRRHKQDNKFIQQFEYNLEENLFNLQQGLKNFTYHSSRMKRLLIPNRPCRKPIYSGCLKDRIVQQAIRMLIEPVFNKTFIHDSYAFRIGKGTHSAIRRLDCFKRKVARRSEPDSGHILKMDIKEFYPNINHRILLSILTRKLKDRRLIWLLKDFLRKSPNKTFSVFGPKGILVGSPLSQTLANIYLNELDYFVKYSLVHKYYLRFADDFTIMDKEDLAKTKALISNYLWRVLLLSPHPQKTTFTTTDRGVNFLGYKIFCFYKRIKNKNIGSFKEKMKRLKQNYSQGLIGQEKLTQKIRGWIEYAKYANSYNLRKSLFSRCVFVRKTKEDKFKK